MCGYCSHATEALVPAICYLFFKIGHNDRFIPSEVAGEVGEAWESDEGFKVLIIKSLVERLIRSMLDAGIIGISVFSNLLLVSFLILLG